MAYVTTKTVAETFGVTDQTVRNWRRNDPDFPAVNIGTKEHPNYRYVIEEVKEYKEVINGKARQNRLHLERGI